MRKLISVLLALVLLLASAAFAEETWMEYDFGGFTMAFPIDIIGTVSEEIVENEPFLYLFQDYDENAIFNKNLNCVWNSGVDNISAVDPEEFAQMILPQMVAAFEQSGLSVHGAEVLAAVHDEHKGEPCLSAIYACILDYSAFGGPAEFVLYTLQSMVSNEAFGGTYTFTISTDDIESTQLLMEIMDTINWNK